MAGVEQNRYKTNNGCIKHLPQTGYLNMMTNFTGSSISISPILLKSSLFQLVISRLSFKTTCSKPVDNKFWQSTCNKSVDNLQQTCQRLDLSLV